MYVWLDRSMTILFKHNQLYQLITIMTNLLKRVKTQQTLLLKKWDKIIGAKNLFMITIYVCITIANILSNYAGCTALWICQQNGVSKKKLDNLSTSHIQVSSLVLIWSVRFILWSNYQNLSLKPFHLTTFSNSTPTSKKQFLSRSLLNPTELMPIFRTIKLPLLPSKQYHKTSPCFCYDMTFQIHVLTFKCMFL